MLADAVDDTENALNVDLSDVGFLGVSSALALVGAQVHSDMQHRGLLLVPGYPVCRTLSVTGLLDSFRCLTSAQEAVGALRADQVASA